MPTLTIKGYKIPVDDNFASLPAEQQQAYVEEVWGAIQRAAPPAPDPKDPNDKSRKGSLLPLSYDKEGNRHFDLSAGITGSAGRAVSLPGEVMRGQIDPGSPEGISRVMEMAAWGTPISPGLRSGVGIMGAPIPRKAAPTTGELYSAGDKLFKSMRQSGVDYDLNAVKQWADDLTLALKREGFTEKSGAEGTIGLLSELTGPRPAGAVAHSIDDLASFRKNLTNLVGKGSTEGKAARIVRDALDSFIHGGASGSSLARLPGGRPAGAPQVEAAKKAAEDLGSANANWAAAKRRQTIENALYNAENQAAAANSGQNVGNVGRQKVRGLLNRNAQGYDKLRGWTPEEKAALEEIVRGTPMRNKVRGASNFLGGGGGLGSMLTTGAGAGVGSYFGGPMGGVLGGYAARTVGSSAKALENSMTAKALGKAATAATRRAPLYNELVYPGRIATSNVPQKPLTAARAALINELIKELDDKKGTPARKRLIDLLAE